MIFTLAQSPQSISIPFNWAVDYYDGGFLTEYDLKTHRSNDFYSIKQDEAYRFGLFGQGMKFYFETTDGHFHLNGRRIEIVYLDEDNNIFNLTNNTSHKNLITYKQAYTNFNKNTIEQKTNIESINFGYKTMINQHDTQLFFQPIVVIPFNSSVYIQVKLTSNRNLNGKLIFYVSGKERERFEAPLKANVSGQINWTVK